MSYQTTMQKTCSDLAEGLLKHENPDDVIQQLRAEGKRRIDAFVFELGFKRRLTIISSDVPGLTLSFGWHIGYNMYNQPAYWFRLQQSDDDWNACDQMMTTRLAAYRIGQYGSKVSIIKVQYLRSSNEFVASSFTGAGWERWDPIDRTLSSLPLKRGARAPREMKNVDPGSADLAFKWLMHPGLSNELPELSIQRRFMNCILGPALGSDGTDLDALALMDGKELHCIEFKRKYPATGRSKFFGIDQIPHIRTMRTLGEMGIRSLHILLVGPRWSKDESPVDWLNDRGLDSAWTWLAANMDSNAFENIALRTHGSDSGQRPGEREQEAIRWDRIKLLNEGLKFDPAGTARLIHLLGGGDLTDGAMTYENLFSRRSAA